MTLFDKADQWLDEQAELTQLDDTSDFPWGHGLMFKSPEERAADLDAWVAQKLLEAAEISGEVPDALREALEELDRERTEKLASGLVFSTELELYLTEGSPGKLVLTVNEEAQGIIPDSAWEADPHDLAFSILYRLLETLQNGTVRGVVLNDYGDWED